MGNDHDDDGALDEEGSCCCCHCGSGPEATKNKSYQKMREHLQQRLRAKSVGMHHNHSGCESSTGSRSSSSRSAADSNINGYAELDYLVSYIEGKKDDAKAPIQPNPKKAAKRARQKAKKLEQQKAEELAAAAAAANKKAAEKAAARGKHQQQQGPPSNNKTTQDRVPNGMVRITHNPLTNSAVITPLYGPLEPNPSYLQQPLGLASQPASRMAAPSSNPLMDSSLKINTPASAQQQQPTKMPTSSTPSQPQQMVTIRRVMQPNLSEPVVTVTLKGDTPDYDRVLFTLVNGQVLPTGSKPGPTVNKNGGVPPSSNNATTVHQPPTVPPPISKKKQKKQEKRKQKKLLEAAASKGDTQQPTVQQQPLRQLNVQMFPDFPTSTPPSSFHHQQSNDFTLDNFRLPPGITLTRVQGTHTSTHPELPVRMVDRGSNKRDNVSSTANPSPAGPNPIIVTNPPKAKESMGSLGGLAAPNVIVVDTRKIQPQQQQPEKRMCSVAVQTGWDENDVDESQLSKKQRKKLRRKQEQEQQAMMDQLAALQLSKKATGKTKNGSTSTTASATTKVSNGSANKQHPPQSGAPAQPAKATSGKNKKKKRSAGANGQASGEDKWEESVFVPKSDLDLEGGDLDEDERELEAFKRFCFNTVPPERKEKVRIHLNVKDIFGKKSSSTSTSNGGIGQQHQHSTSCK